MMDVINHMNEDWSTPALVIASSLALALWWRSQKPTNAPPGPAGLPYFGSFIQLYQNFRGDNYVNYIIEQHKKYGSIFCLQAGTQRLIYINDATLVTQLYKKDEFALRPVKTFPAINKLTQGKPVGLVFGNGEAHSVMRKFTLLALKDLGIGKKSIDEMIQTEATILCQHLETLAESRDGLMTDIQAKLRYATMNIIHHVIFGCRREYEDPEYLNFSEALYELLQINFIAFPENFIPILEKIPPLNRYLTNNENKRFYEISEDLRDYINSHIEDHRGSYVEGEVRDFIDLFIKYEAEESEFYTKSNIFTTILDLFAAGADTTASTLSWIIMYLVKYPDIQSQLRHEIDEVVGDRQLEKQQKIELVKTRAFINEVVRFVSIVPTDVPHTVEKPEVVNGFILQPNDVISASLHAIHHDEDYWGDPYTFRIERWIDEKGELTKHEGHFYPFSVGKRSCPGREFASIEMILILVQFLQNFTFEQADGYSELPDEPRLDSLIRSPHSYHIKVIKRR